MSEAVERKVVRGANTLTEHEARQMARNAEAVQRDREAARHVGVRASGYVHAVSPENGESVVFLPGELLPDWAAEAYRRGSVADGVDVLVALGLRPDSGAQQ